MATYIILGRYTQQGIQNIREGPARTSAAKKNVQALGGEFKAFYIVMGQYDFVAIIEAPDDETAAIGSFSFRQYVIDVSVLDTSAT